MFKVYFLFHCILFFELWGISSIYVLIWHAFLELGKVCNRIEVRFKSTYLAIFLNLVHNCFKTYVKKLINGTCLENIFWPTLRKKLLVASSTRNSFSNSLNMPFFILSLQLWMHFLYLKLSYFHVFVHILSNPRAVGRSENPEGGDKRWCGGIICLPPPE